jgi:hypothetical protein
MCGVKTNVVTSVEISDGYANDHGLCHNLCVVIQSQHELGIETNFTDELAA